jgi:hypothetical protein
MLIIIAFKYYKFYSQGSKFSWIEKKRDFTLLKLRPEVRDSF